MSRRGRRGVSFLDKDFREPSPWPWPVWVMAVVLAFGVGTCRAHQTAGSPTTTTTIPATTTTTAPVPLLTTEPGSWDIVAPCYHGPQDRGAEDCAGRLYPDMGPFLDDLDSQLWCGDPSNPGVGLAPRIDGSLPDGGLPAVGHSCTWPELKAEGWRKLGPQKEPRHSFWCSDHPCTAEELTKAKRYQASLHPLVTP